MRRCGRSWILPRSSGTLVLDVASPARTMREGHRWVVEELTARRCAGETSWRFGRLSRSSRRSMQRERSRESRSCPRCSATSGGSSRSPLGSSVPATRSAESDGCATRSCSTTSAVTERDMAAVRRAARSIGRSGGSGASATTTPSVSSFGTQPTRSSGSWRSTTRARRGRGRRAKLSIGVRRPSSWERPSPSVLGRTVAAAGGHLWECLAVDLRPRHRTTHRQRAAPAVQRTTRV